MRLKKRVLFIAYLFPPTGGGGVQRTVKFVKYLPEFGWQPTILTTSAPGTLSDASIASDVSPQTSVVRVRGVVPPHYLPWRFRHWLKQWLLVVDQEIGWLPFAVRRGIKLLRQQNCQAIFSTSRPYTDHLVAMRLKRATSLPWIADFRDPWVGNLYAGFATPLHRAICARLESSIAHLADRVLVVSEPMRQQFLARYPDLPSSRFLTLPNGFDPVDFRNARLAERDARFTLVYTGTFYGKRQSAHPFLSALRQVLDRNLIARNHLCVRLVGNTGHEAMGLVAQWGLGDVVEFTGYLPHAEVIGQQLCADALLLIIGAGVGSEIVLTGKIFEYLAAGKPILALIPPGAAADLLTEAQVGHIASPDDPDAVAVALTEIYTDWEEGLTSTPPNPAVVSRYDRRRQVGELADILNEVSR